MIEVIYRPKGHKEVIRTDQGPVEMEYPVDYAFVCGIGMNRQDGEEPDIFVGTGGHIYGRFTVGLPREHKWFCGLTGREFKELYRWWHQRNDGEATFDWKVFPSKTALFEDMKQHCSTNKE